MIKKLLIGLVALILGVVGIVVVLASENALVFHPKGLIAREQLELIVINLLLMLVIIIPTYILLFVIVWKYCIRNESAKHDSEHSFGPIGELVMWGLPSIIVAILAIVTWDRTHQLDPYKPLESEVKPMTVQVVAMNWKWLFIYPDLGIATLNYLYIPDRTPIHLRLTADAAPMNSFWVPQLSGQIYAMTGMSTQLHLMADAPGEYAGRAVEINGEGYAGMTFSVKSASKESFEDWVTQVKSSPDRLTEDVYNNLVKPSVNRSVILFSAVPKGLYHQIIHKYMYPTKPVL